MHADTQQHDIVTPHLRLRLMSLAFLDACLRGRVAEAAARLGATIPVEWFAEVNIISWFWQRIRDDPAYAQFAPRAMLRVAPAQALELEMVGHIGFHTTPNPDYLRELVGEGIEIGYTVFAQARRLGYAEESIRAMSRWVAHEHAVSQLVASIGIDNAPSRALADKLGFVKVGEHIDEIDGPEDVLVLQLSDFAVRAGTEDSSGEAARGREEAARGRED